MRIGEGVLQCIVSFCLLPLRGSISLKLLFPLTPLSPSRSRRKSVARVANSVLSKCKVSVKAPTDRKRFGNAAQSVKFFKRNKAMYEGKLQEIFTQNDFKYQSAYYLDNLNQVQSYLTVNIRKSHRIAESHPVCLDLKDVRGWLRHNI